MAGAVGLPEGGSGRPLVIWVLPLQGQEPVDGGDQRGVVIPAQPGAAFVVVQAELAAIQCEQQRPGVSSYFPRKKSVGESRSWGCESV